jgi:hypothetical protein
VKSIRYFTYSSVVALLLSAGAVRAADESPFKFEFHGFVTGSMFIQDQVFLGGAGQDNLFAAPTPANSAPCEPAGCTGITKSDSFLGADARQSRWIFVVTGPKAFGATPKSYFEGDFYGASASGAALNAWEHTQARLRAAFGELKWGSTALQFGQYSAQLILASLSASVAHIANPITFGTGTIGSRAVGVRVVHSMPVGALKLELAGELLAPKWLDPARTATPAAIGAGWASGIPQIGVRAKADGKAGNLGYSLYLAGEFQQADLKGFGETSTGVTLADGSTEDSLSPYAVELGGNFVFAPVSLAFNVYTGKATGAWGGAINQHGGIQDLGYWVQLGVHPTKQISLFGLYGAGSADEDDVRNWGVATAIPNTAQRSENQLIGGIARFSDGGYTFALEYFNFNTTYLQGTLAAPGADVETDGYQLIVSGHYAF